ncbi:Ubiquitin carboxyl-terminal hydrolase 23 [Hirschfeldia incana]|nr:Ubiquitin carboxyl-terminal hydrolase 23 [Hirschfeldia incana]
MEAASNGPFAVTSSSASAVFRKIEFHPARKPWNGFSNKSGSDFKLETLNPSFSANKQALSSPSLKKGSDSSEHGLDRELTFNKTIRKIGAGLENLGNTCFLNSVLQCLTYTEPLAAYLQDVGHEKRCRVAGFCALCAMQKHVRDALQASGKILSPKYLVSNLRCVSRNFRNCRQEDAHEYMINLLECMHKNCLPSGVPSESSDAYRTSLVHKIFGGSLRSRVTCAKCSHCSDKFDPFLDLSLDITKADSLQRALARFTADELLDDGAKVYQCERCKQKVKATKQLTVSKAPYVLTVHLKRFEAHRSDKIDRKVEFPSAIDMKPFVSGPYEGNLKYTLYSVLVHYGRSTHSGHYACFVRPSSGMWYSLDDNRVSQASEKNVFSQKAYMLFYVRDRQNPAPKNAAAMVKKDISKESLATNRAPIIKSSNGNDQVSGSTVMKASSLNGLGANGTAILRSCDQRAPPVFTQKISNVKEAQKDPPSSVEAKEILERENGTAPLKSCALSAAAAAVTSQRDSKSKENLLKELPLSQANGEGSLVKAESIKTTSDEETLATPRKTRKGKTKTLQVGLRPFKLSLGVRKKKKQKKGRSSTLAVKVISEELLSKDRDTDQERSTSEITSEVASGSSCLPGKDNTGNVLLGSATGDLKERTNQNGTVLASDQQEPLRSSGLSKASQIAKRKREASKDEQIVLQKDEPTILTRGLPDTVVAKWDEEVSASKKMGVNEGTEIGYVADECWYWNVAGMKSMIEGRKRR